MDGVDKFLRKFWAKVKEVFGLPSPSTDAKGPIDVAEYYGIGSAYSEAELVNGIISDEQLSLSVNIPRDDEFAKVCAFKFWFE